MAHACAIALGGNLGKVAETFREAIRRLETDDRLQITAGSRIYSTLPVGTHAGPPFLNAVALLEADCEPQVLLARLHDVETELGRERQTRWGPRSLDLDLLHVDQITRGTSTSPATLLQHLVLPHPTCWIRRFVLDPWADVAPEWRHPLLGESVSALRLRLLARPMTVALRGPADWSQSISTALHTTFPGTIEITERIEAGGSAPVVEFQLEPLTRDQIPQRCLALPSDPQEASRWAVEILRGALDSPQSTGLDLN